MTDTVPPLQAVRNALIPLREKTGYLNPVQRRGYVPVPRPTNRCYELTYGEVWALVDAVDSFVHDLKAATDALTESEARLAIILAFALQADGVVFSEIPTRAITELRAASGGAGQGEIGNG